MAIQFYFDVHVPAVLASQLRLREVDVLLAQDDGADRLSDEDLLARAGKLARVVVTFDHRFRSFAEDCIRRGVPFHGLVFADLNAATIGKLVADLDFLAKAAAPGDVINTVIRLPWS